MNAEAALRSKKRVSPECIVLSYRSDGTGAMLLDGEAVEVPPQFPHIMNGIDITRVIVESLREGGLDASKARLVEIGSASSREGRQPTTQSTPCSYAIIDSDPSAGYDLAEITTDDFKLVSARAVSDRGQIVGTGRAGFRTDQPSNIPWSYFDGQVVRLNYAGLAAAVNDKGHVVAVLQGHDAPPPSWQRAAMYDGDGLIELPLYHQEHENPERSDSEASAINNSSVMAGSVAIQHDKSARLKIFAAVFRAGQPLVVFDGLQPEYGSRAFKVNEQGHVLLMANPGPSDARPVIWNPADRRWHYVSGGDGNVFPITMTDDEVVLGQARNKDNQPVAVLCRPGGTWERLGTPDNWVPVDINNKGEVVGRVRLDLLERPWLYRPGRGTVMLPHTTDHHSSPSAINNFGQVVGGAGADSDCHALLWTPK